MRWTAFNVPADGTIRIRRGFLLFPKLIEGEWRWLEYTTWVQEFRYLQGYGGWISIEWR